MKKVLASAVALGLSVLLVSGCGSTPSAPSDSNTPAASEVTTPTKSLPPLADYKGKNLKEAKKTLEDLGFKVEVKSDNGKSVIAESNWTVISQVPAAGKTGSEVTLTVGKPKDPSSAPSPSTSKAPAASGPYAAAINAAAVSGLKIEDTGGGVLFASFPIADSLTKKLISFGAKSSTLAILKSIKANVPSYVKVFVQGSFETKDSYGNSKNSIVLNAGYLKETVDKINFDGIDISGIWDIKDDGMVHPDLDS